MQVTLTGADTEDIPPGRYYHEAKVVTAEGKESTIATGRLTIRATLIRP